MAVKWSADLVTNIPALDEHHQGIFDCINNFCERCDQDGGTSELVALLDLLDRYTRKHFSYEEALQRMNNYPGLPVQQEQHASFLADVAELKRAVEADGPSRRLAATARAKLVRWLFHHIKTVDREFVDFLNR